MMKAKKGMGFKAAQEKIAKQPNRRGKGKLGMEKAGAILASGARKAGTKAKKANPNLKKVRGK